MPNITIRKNNDSNLWLVTVAGVDIRFESEKAATKFAAQLRSRILELYKLNQENLFDHHPNLHL